MPQYASDLLEPVSVVALTMVAFLLGGELTRENMTSNGRAIFSISLSVVIGTTLAIWAGFTAFGLDPSSRSSLNQLRRQRTPLRSQKLFASLVCATDSPRHSKALSQLMMFGAYLFSASALRLWISLAAGRHRCWGRGAIWGCNSAWSVSWHPVRLPDGSLSPREPLQTEAIAAASFKQKSALVSVAPKAPLLQRMPAFRPV